MENETIGNAPIGAEPAQSTNDNTTVEQGTPQVFELPDENALVRIKGQDKPVKYGEIGRNFQSQWTRSQQELARAREELTREKEARQRFEQERQRQSQSGNQPDPLAPLREKPYLTGEETAEVVNGIVQQVRQRDTYIAALIQRMQAMEARTGQLYETHTNSAFDTKISKWVSDLGYDPQSEGISDLAKEIYLAYEGNDLDQEFPRILGDRLKQIEAVFEARKRSQLESSRRQPFVPGRGGQAGPSRPLQIRPNASPREVAELLWNDTNGSGT